MQSWWSAAAKITIVSFIEDGVAHEVKRRIDLDATDNRRSAVKLDVVNVVPLHLCGRLHALYVDDSDRESLDTSIQFKR